MEQRLIDANALRYRMGVNQDDKQIFYVTGEDIDAAPTIDPESLWTRAQWIPRRMKFPGESLTVTMYECGLCEKQQWNATNFCPNCGAKMEDESDGDVRCR